MIIKNVKCPYCDIRLQYRGTKRIQLGKSGIIFEHLDHWLSGALSVRIYECPACGKLEFFSSDKTKGKKDKNGTIIDL